MRYHARPARRPSHRRRRVLVSLAIAAVGLLVLPALLARGPSSLSGPGAIGQDGAAIGLEPTAAQNLRAATSSAAPASSSPGPAAEIPDAATTREIPPARIALDAWPVPTPPPVASLTGYTWPLAHPRLTLPFGPTAWGSRVVDGQLFHDGVDLATFCGDHVLAAHDGVVLAAGRHFDDFMGWVGSLARYTARLDQKHLWMELPIVVVIDDGDGYRSMYAHFSRVTVHVGQRVRAGQLIGYEGMTGHATGCHVHFGLYAPLETRTFGIDPAVAKRMQLPGLEIARIDPLLVLPPKKGINAGASPDPAAPTSP
jgi:murein DD-endopeptidase MepM/ murein hydrolase activator NlpD